MRIPIPLSLLLLLATEAQSHYLFSHFVINGELSPEWKYIRKVAADPDRTTKGENETALDYAFGQMYPIYDIKSEAMTCGREAFKSAQTTDTVDVKSGELFGFHLSKVFENTALDQLGTIFHMGPAQVYLARAPNDDLSNFNGNDGKWFKIASLATAHDTEPYPDWWVPYQHRQLNFTIPSATPAGKYLLRIEHFQIGKPGTAQFYAACAQVNIVSKGEGIIPEESYARFPGTYDAADPSIDTTSEELSKPGNMLKYVGPGPKVWTGEATKIRKMKFRA